jgi:hypothetical protein
LLGKRANISLVGEKKKIFFVRNCCGCPLVDVAVGCSGRNGTMLTVLYEPLVVWVEGSSVIFVTLLSLLELPMINWVIFCSVASFCRVVPNCALAVCHLVTGFS